MNNQSTANHLDTPNPALTNTQAPFAPVAQPQIPLNQTANELDSPIANSLTTSPTTPAPITPANPAADNLTPITATESEADLSPASPTPIQENAGNNVFPQPPQAPKKELPMVAIIALIAVLIIVLGCIIVFSVMNDSRDQAPLDVMLPEDDDSELEALMPPSQAPLISSLSAVSTDAFAQSLDINCVADKDGNETIAWAELPFSLNQEVKQHFDLLLADSLPCSVGLSDTGRPVPMSRYVMLANNNNPKQLDRLYFIHANSRPADTLTHVSNNVFAFSDTPACDQRNLCYRSPKDNIEFYLNSEDGNNFSPQKLCVLISDSGKFSADQTLLAKLYVGECFNPETEFEAIYQVYRQHGTGNATEWQLKKPEKITDFYRDLTTVYKGSMRYLDLLQRLQTLTNGISFN